MAPKKFERKWNELFPEIRCMIWKLKANEERVIRVENKTMVLSDHTKPIYYLTAGPVPKIMHICKESRAEGLKYYTPVRSRAAMSLASEHPYAQRANEYIFINFETDTLMFTKMSSNFETYSWIRRIPREQKLIIKMILGQLSIKKPDEENAEENTNARSAGQEIERESTTIVQVERPVKTIQHVAFQSYDVLHWSMRASRLDFFYGLVMILPRLKTLKIVTNCLNRFPVTKNPHMYVFRNETQLQPTNNPVQAPLPRTGIDCSIACATDRFWDNSVNMGPLAGTIIDDLNQSKKYRAWRETNEEGKAWVPPAIETVRLAQSKKKHVRGH